MKNKESIYKQALEKWGAKSQIMMVCEEMAELQKELCKAWRGMENIYRILEGLLRRE